MAKASTWTNADGLRVGFGARDSKNAAAATVQTEGNICVMQFPFDYDVVETIGTAPSSTSIPIPANATIMRGNIRVTTAFAGGTSINFGTMDSAGTAIDADGLDAAVAVADMDAVGDVVTFDGAQIGKRIASDAYFGIQYTGTYTAGRGVVTIEYLKGMEDSLPTEPITGIVGSL
jgi:hypothetical protein